MPSLERAGMGGIITLSGFSGNGFRIGQTHFADGLLIWPEDAQGWLPPLLATLAIGDFAPFDRAQPPLDVVLLGTGSRLQRPSRELFAALGAKGMGLEPMDSRAAARTYNLLAGEGRRVGAALYPLDA